MKLRTPLKQGIWRLAAAAKRHYTFPRVGQITLRDCGSSAAQNNANMLILCD